MAVREVVISDSVETTEVVASGSFPVTTRKKPTGSFEKLRTNSLDKRFKEAKEAARMREQITEDLGGPDRLTEAKRLLIERIVFKAMKARMIELAVLSSGDGGLLDADRYYMALVNSLRKDLTTLGLNRVKRATNLKDYIETKAVEVK